MPPMNTKNLPLSPAATDLGLGTMLQNQVEAQALELKKKKQSQTAMSPMGGAVDALFGTAGVGM